MTTSGRFYNAADDLILRNLAAERGAKVAYLDDAGSVTYAELAERVNRVASALRGLGLQMEDRLLLAHVDNVDFVAVFLGAIKAGIVPIPVNTLLAPYDYAFLLDDSRARALVVSSGLLPALAPCLEGARFLRQVIVSL